MPAGSQNSAPEHSSCRFLLVRSGRFDHDAEVEQLLELFQPDNHLLIGAHID
jgi:hypothetical protein